MHGMTEIVDEHELGRNLDMSRTPKYANAVIIPITTNIAHPYVIKNSNALCDLFFM
jgi:hypothetical protein